MNPMRVLFALPIVALLTATTVTPVHAATGEFFFETDAGRQMRLVSPPPNRCIRLPEPSPAVSNQTDGRAHLFVSPDCQGQLMEVPSRGTWRKEVYSARSVRFD
jgi:hypothetical protein